MPTDVAISMTWAQWKAIDAAMDNTGSTAAVGLESEVVDRTSSIRRIGWDATRHIDRPYMDRGEWPPPESVRLEPVTVTLSRGEWRFVLEELHRWAEAGGRESVGGTVLADLIHGSLQPS